MGGGRKAANHGAQVLETMSAMMLALWGMFMEALAIRMLMESNMCVRIIVGRNLMSTE